MEGRSKDAAVGCDAILSEAVVNIRTVQTLTLEPRFRRKFLVATNKAFQIGVRKALRCGFFYGLSEASTIFVAALLFYYGAVLVATHQFFVSEVILATTMLLFCMANLGAIMAFIPQIQSSKDAAMRLLGLLRLPLTSHETEGSLHLDFPITDIIFQDVSFAYPSHPGHPVLANVSMTFHSGTSTALVGPSGSGKSTIASLLLRLYPLPSSSSLITISGKSISVFDASLLRSKIALVSQSPVLFPMSVVDNITYGLPPDSPHATLSSIHEAAKAAGCHEFIVSLPQGYATLVGDGGMGLSGGQVQRIAIARALVRKPAMLVLDEVTSALDAGSTEKVMRTVRELVNGKWGKKVIVVCITHDEAVMRACEKVVMMDGGEVVEEGQFEELKSRKGGKVAQLLSA